MVFSIIMQCKYSICHIKSCFLSCFGAVLSHVHLQLIRLFAGVVALIASQRFLAGV